MLTIGALAKATDTKVVTVRYYEQAGLFCGSSKDARCDPSGLGAHSQIYDRTIRPECSNRHDEQIHEKNPGVAPTVLRPTHGHKQKQLPADQTEKHAEDDHRG